MRDVMKSIDTIRQEADKRLRAQQSRQSGQQCGPVELKKEVSFKAQAALSTQRWLQNRQQKRSDPVWEHDKIWDQIKNRLTTQKQQPSPPSISSQTGQQTEKQ
ncbi:hypothetical protein AAFF_G00410710 [Aldrovandia affinis]|uniref:Uncharacterized protein n=1 Tax=Aldrovandia affinis TaxID=143900 RepID=A0AAD7VYN3_9TELE|nr:hypothetical protein AAFF_G00410710 [Aldrovandia affinis]